MIASLVRSSSDLHGLVAHLGEVGMAPTVVADLVPFGDGALEDFRVRLARSRPARKT